MFGHRPNTLARGIKRVLGDNAVGSLEPPLSFDFTQNRYSTVGGTKSLSSALTHVRNGNATMVDGYGPELVTNGTFDSDTSGWTENTSGVVEHLGSGAIAIKDGNDSVNTTFTQTISTEVGKTYLISWDVLSTSGTGFRVGVAGVYLEGGTYFNSSQELAFTATTSSTLIELYRYRFHDGRQVVDNISVREMPVLKWAPHNLLKYSEDFSNAAWSPTNATKTTGVADPFGGLTATTITATAANGQILQSGIISQGVGATYTSKVYIRRRTGAGAVYLFNPNGAGISSISGLTSEWQEFSITGVGAVSTNFSGVRLATSGDAVDVAFAHLYRSDLGGMVDNPDRGDSYVPTTSSAVYLPRIGHHEYNGYEWVDKGLLAESEARTNQFLTSDLSSVTATTFCTVTPYSETGRDGKLSLAKAERTSGGSDVDNFQYQNSSPTQGVVYTATGVFKAGTATLTRFLLRDSVSTGYIDIAWSGGVPSITVSNATTVSAHFVDCGNGLYRIGLSYLVDAATTYVRWEVQPSRGSDGYVFVGEAQLEVGSVPSSYIPTSGSTVTRAAETFTVPSANLPWPTAEVIGPELVTNGTFDTDSDWTKGTGWTISGGVAVSDGTSQYTELKQSISGFDTGKAYKVSFDIVVNAGVARFFTDGVAYENITSSGTYEYIFRPSTSALSPRIQSRSPAFNGTVDNISVREINPLSVSIQMKGQVSYADTDDYEAYFHRWYKDVNTYVQTALDATSTRTGMPRFFQNDTGYTVAQVAGLDAYSPGLNVPFDIASRHGSTFVNGAVDGVALTADTTPTALPDLSSTDLSLAYDFMGTISEFRIWDKDLGDSGLEEATEPSTEPTLSLTFDGQSSSFTDTGYLP